MCCSSSASPLSAACCLYWGDDMELNWRNAKTEIPAYSMDVVAVTPEGRVTTVSYSWKHRAFNSVDHRPPENEIDVAYWMPKEEFDEHIKRETEKEMKRRDAERNR